MQRKLPYCYTVLLSCWIQALRHRLRHRLPIGRRRCYRVALHHHYSVLVLLRSSFFRARSPSTIAGVVIQPLPRRHASPLLLPPYCVHSVTIATSPLLPRCRVVKTMLSPHCRHHRVVLLGSCCPGTSRVSTLLLPSLP